MARNFLNNVPATTLNGAVNSTVTTWTVADGTGYPAVPFAAKCESEVVEVTAKSGTNDVTWTVTRGFDGTTRASHADGADVTDAVIAADMKMPEWMRYLAGRLSDETAHTDDDFFDDDSKGFTETTVSGTATWTEKYGRASVVFSGQTAGDAAVALYAMTPSSSPVTIETALTRIGIDANYPSIGLCFTDGTTASDNIALVRIVNAVNTGAISIRNCAGTLTSYTTVNTIVSSHTSMPFMNLGLRFIWKSSNTFQIQFGDLVSWSTLGFATLSKTMTPTHFGMFVSSQSYAEPSIAGFDYLRVYESDLSA